MNNYFNKKGISLVVVLIVIVILSITGITITNMTVSHNKQVTTSEQDMIAVDLAEMGVIYYKNVFVQHANTVLTQAIADAQRTIASENMKIQQENEKK